LLGAHIDRDGKFGPLGTYHDNPIMFHSPVYHTTLLYWACKFEKVEKNLVEEILQKFEAYPEGPIKMEIRRTPSHAAAEVGNNEKLKLLLQDVFNRYMKPLKPEEVRTFQKHNICLYFMNRWTSLLKQEKYK